jgi:hypothetical protein
VDNCRKKKKRALPPLKDVRGREWEKAERERVALTKHVRAEITIKTEKDSVAQRAHSRGRGKGEGGTARDTAIASTSHHRAALLHPTPPLFTKQTTARLFPTWHRNTHTHTHTSWSSAPFSLHSYPAPAYSSLG